MRETANVGEYSRPRDDRLYESMSQQQISSAESAVNVAPLSSLSTSRISSSTPQVTTFAVSTQKVTTFDTALGRPFIKRHATETQV